MGAFSRSCILWQLLHYFFFIKSLSSGPVRIIHSPVGKGPRSPYHPIWCLNLFYNISTTKGIIYPSVLNLAIHRPPSQYLSSPILFFSCILQKCVMVNVKIQLHKSTWAVQIVCTVHITDGLGENFCYQSLEIILDMLNTPSMVLAICRGSLPSVCEIMGLMY